MSEIRIVFLKRKFFVFKYLATSLLVLLTLCSQVVLAETAKEAVKDTIDQLVAVVEQNQSEAEIARRRELMREVISPRFDFEEMAKRSLGAHWKLISSEQQQQFIEVFSKLLAKTYLNKIENLRKDTVSVNSEKTLGDKALVKTVVQYKGDNFPLDYKLISANGNWKVYDVVIENIGLISNYRNEFAGIIRKKEFSGLLEDLSVKAAD